MTLTHCTQDYRWRPRKLYQKPYQNVTFFLKTPPEVRSDTRLPQHGATERDFKMREIKLDAADIEK
jgi:hypothetical protein